MDLHTVSDNIDKVTLSTLKRFIIILYDIASEYLELDVARKQMFTKKSTALEALPPTSDAFVQNVKRTVMKAVHRWLVCFNKHLPTVDPGQWGWVKDDDKWATVLDDMMTLRSV